MSRLVPGCLFGAIALWPITTLAQTLPAGHEVLVELAEPVTSASMRDGQRFRIRLTSPIESGGVTFAAAGAEGEGQIVHARKAGSAGKPGELILAARFVLAGDQKIALRGFQLASMTGKSSYTAATVGLLVAGPVTFLVRGGNIEMPLGTRGIAKLVMPLGDQASAPLADNNLQPPSSGETSQ